MEEPADISSWKPIDRISPLLLVSLPFGFFIVGNSIFIDSCSVHWIEPRESRAECFTSVNSLECFFRGLCVARICACTISGRGKWETPRRLWNRPVCGTSAWWWWRQTRHLWMYWMPGGNKKNSVASREWLRWLVSLSGGVWSHLVHEGFPGQVGHRFQLLNKTNQWDVLKVQWCKIGFQVHMSNNSQASRPW